MHAASSNQNTASGCKTVSWTLLPRPYHTCSSFSTLASCLWTYALKLALLMYRACTDELPSYCILWSSPSSHNKHNYKDRFNAQYIQHIKWVYIQHLKWVPTSEVKTRRTCKCRIRQLTRSRRRWLTHALVGISSQYLWSLRSLNTELKPNHQLQTSVLVQELMNCYFSPNTTGHNYINTYLYKSIYTIWYHILIGSGISSQYLEYLFSKHWTQPEPSNQLPSISICKPPMMGGLYIEMAVLKMLDKMITKCSCPYISG